MREGSYKKIHKLLSSEAHACATRKYMHVFVTILQFILGSDQIPMYSPSYSCTGSEGGGANN